ncbi:SDR family NAD(P)-dependent oxidoreductase [Agrilactobacillus yilanensis]|uniref:SDR family NAD(P)-dependent oxidoreductase n=1 Tax=Agrilactobacillus yilanensis TaxID=2485997 RepID=A0ABW4J8P2_9LACO|nr:SDR family NAD(P)-dependent oxidoreductase [Agrilactobacillus yilanensis]
MKKLAALKNLNEKVVVITGGSSGIGRACAFQAAQRGAVVVVAARNMEKLETVRRECQLLSKHAAYAYTLDIGDPDSIETFCQAVTTQVGPIDVLINAAGFGNFENTVDTDPKLIEKMIRVNLLGTIYITRLVARSMMGRPGHIFLLGSMAGKIATAKSAIYSASKFAVVGYANGLRLELRPFNIQVTTINPGPVDTNFFNIADKSGNYLEKVGQITLDPDKLAQRMINAVGFTVREINVPLIMNVAAHFYDLFPRVGDYLASTLFDKK